MKKLILPLLFNIFLISLLQAQNEEVIHSGTKTGFENKSYLVIQTLTLGPGFSVNAATNGTFFARAYRSANSNEPPSPDQNYVRTETILSGSITTEDQIANLGMGGKAVSYDYLDGLGRASQSTVVQGSPQKRDIIQPFAYDQASRSEYEYLPYSYNTSTGAFRTSPVSEQSSFYTSTSKVSNDSRAKTQNVFEKSPLGRIKESYGLGDNWYTNTKKSTADFTVAGTSIPRWTINDSDLPVTSGNYPENLLTVTSTVTEDGITVTEYVDYRGLTVRKEVDTSSPLVTVYVYDDLGNLRYILPPKISSLIAPTQNQLDAWGFQFKYQYEYDATYGTPRLIKRKKQPGVNTDWVFEVYDEWGRLAASQDGNQRNHSPSSSKEWMYVKYDAFNRPVVTGKFTSSNSPEGMAAAMSADAHHEDENSSAVGYSLTGSFPRYAEFGSVTESNILSINYYDDYSFLSISGWDAESNSFTFSNPGGFSNTKLDPVKGQVTGTKTKNMASGTWLNAVVYYDNKYQPIQAIQENHLAGADRITYAYNFPGWTTKTYRQHTTSIASVNILEEYEYDPMGRLLKLFHTLDGGTRTLLAAYNYNEAGQVVETNLHSTDNGASFLQSVDYRYSVRGWLTHINNSTLGVDGNNDDTNDLFGMQLVYNEETPVISNGSSGTTTVSSRFGGNISAIKWKTDNKKDAPKERIFGYAYDAKDRLTRAFYATKNGSNWSDDAGLFDEDNIGYDNNGNINTLRRYGKISGSKNTLDDLSYNTGGTTSTGNELLTVEDSGNASVGFVNGTNGQVTEYVYDKNGNLESDMNSFLTGASYNDLNLPVTVTYNGGTSSQTSVEFTYDASGYLLRKVYKRGSDVESQADYVNGIQYYNSALGAVFTSEGRATKFNGSWEYEYYLKDHQENTRLVFGYLHDADVYKATMETYYATDEEAKFKKIDITRWTDPAYNHTTASTDVPVPDRSAKLNGSVSGLEVGPGRSFAITSGDKLHMEVYARYNSGSGNASDVVASLVSAATTSLNVTVGENAVAYGGFNTYLPGFVNGMSYNTGNPKAYLNYILFDAGYANPQFGFKEISATSSGKWEKLSLEVTVPYNGYAYIYVTNESNYNVYFDDMLVVHEKNTKSLHVTEATDYYPFGLAIEGTHYVDQSRLLNSYGYQGDYAEFDARTGWNRFELRGNYDSRLGRWMSNDPYAQFSSPYIGMGNNPNLGEDPDGGFFFSLGGALVGAAAGGAVGAGLGYLIDRDHWQQWALFGAVAGAGLGGFTTPKMVMTPGGNFWQRTLAEAKYTVTRRSGTIGGKGFHPFGKTPSVASNVKFKVPSLRRTPFQPPSLDQTMARLTPSNPFAGVNDDIVEIIVNRFQETNNSTLSRFYVRQNGNQGPTGYFLEPAGPSSTVEGSDRRISEGVYNVQQWNSVDHPNTFNVQNVAGRTNILIHSGNFPDDTLGCFLPGASYGTDQVINSVFKMNQIRNFINVQNAGRRVIMYVRNFVPTP